MRYRHKDNTPYIYIPTQYIPFLDRCCVTIPLSFKLLFLSGFPLTSPWSHKMYLSLHKAELRIGICLTAVKREKWAKSTSYQQVSVVESVIHFFLKLMTFPCRSGIVSLNTACTAGMERGVTRWNEFKKKMKWKKKYSWRPERNYTTFSGGFSAVCQVIHLKVRYINVSESQKIWKNNKNEWYRNGRYRSCVKWRNMQVF